MTSTITYGRRITWNDRNGNQQSVYTDGHSSYEEAYEVTLKMAQLSGYTKPKIWEWWRWGENNRQFTSFALKRTEYNE